MKKNTLIISAVGGVLLIVLVIILIVVLRGGTVKYEEGMPNVVTTTFTKNMGKELMNGLFPEETAIVNNMSYSEAFTELINGTNDVVLALKPSEEMLNYSQDVLTEVEMIPIAKDALIVMNNRYNPVKNITKEQFQKIYSGKIKNWKEMSGDDLEIIPYLSTTNYDSYFALKEIMNGAELTIPRLTLKAPSFPNIIKAIAEYEDTADYAIGYGFFYDIDTASENKNINVLSINGITPTLETVNNGTYPLNVTVYAIIRKDSTENSRARRLVNFILSEEGQNIIEENGYLKLGK